MKRIVAIIIIIILGAGALFYPTISNYLTEKNGSKAIDAYKGQIAALDEDTLRIEWEKAETYNENLTGSPVHDPFLEGSGIAMPEEYTLTLNVGGQMAYVEIPKIGVYLPIFHGTSDAVLQKGIGHLEGSTLPIGGLNRHSVITGHTGLVHAKLFTDLTAQNKEDLFFIHVLDKVLAYKIDQIKIIEPEITDDLMCFEEKDYVTLMTCTPYGVNSHRLLVRGERVDYDPAAREQIQKVKASDANTLIIKAAIITATIMLVVIRSVMMSTIKRQQRAARTDVARL